jgi:hypothetical protein
MGTKPHAPAEEALPPVDSSACIISIVENWHFIGPDPRLSILNKRNSDSKLRDGTNYYSHHLKLYYVHTG